MKGISLKELNSKALVGFGSLNLLGGVISQNSKVALIYSENLSACDEAKLLNAVSGFKTYGLKLSDGESAKRIERACEITEFLALNGFNRGDVIVAAGGGTVCDLCGFVASVYMRGIKYITVPTTLLCAVDACLGGKTAVDIPHVKNGWGTFYQPMLTVADCDILKNLRGKAFSGGFSEIVKYGVICPDFLDYINEFSCAENIRGDLEEVIYRCLKIKADIVRIDERDLGVRKTLNLGHTVAHAIEQASGYAVEHGESVAMGVYAEAELAVELGELSPERFKKIEKTLYRLIEKFTPQGDLASLIPYMRLDKKNGASGVTFALPTDCGAKIITLSEELLKAILSKISR